MRKRIFKAKTRNGSYHDFSNLRENLNNSQLINQEETPTEGLRNECPLIKIPQQRNPLQLNHKSNKYASHSGNSANFSCKIYFNVIDVELLRKIFNKLDYDNDEFISSDDLAKFKMTNDADEEIDLSAFEKKIIDRERYIDL